MSFAERYMQGILGGLDIKRTQQQMKLADVRNRLFEEEIADMQESRKRRKSLMTLMSKLDPSLQESVLMKEQFPGMPFETTPYGQEQKLARESTPEKMLERRETQGRLRAEAGKEVLPGIMGAYGKDRFVKEVGKPQLGMSALEEMGVVPKREKVRAGVAKKLSGEEKAEWVVRERQKGRDIEDLRKERPDWVWQYERKQKKKGTSGLSNEEKYQLLRSGGTTTPEATPPEKPPTETQFYGATSIAELEEALAQSNFSEEQRNKILEDARKAGLE